jgi:hypothetical protein
MSFPKELTNPAQANGPPIVNEMFEAIAASAMYARNYDTSTGLVLGYFGGHIAGSAIADGTTTLAASEANVYVVAHRTTGAVSSATNTTNWNATSTYGRLYHAVTGASTITTLTDWRHQTGGWFDRTGSVSVDADDVTYTPAVLADWDGAADPGDVEQALDQLAERIADVEGTAVDAAAVTFTPTTTADWDGAADPGNVDDALDQLAERVKDEEIRNTSTALATSGSVAIDLALGDYFTLALAGNVTTFTFSNLPGSGKGASIMVQITQDSTPRTVGWPASFTWEGGTPGTVSTGSGDVDVLALTTFDNGTTWRATLANEFS